MSDGNMTTFTLEPDNAPTMSADEIARLDAMTDEEIEAAAKLDPDAQPLTDEQLEQMERVPNPKFIREALQLTQKAFADMFQLSLSALRDWEQGRFVPDRAARTLLKVISHNPQAVTEALVHWRERARKASRP